MDSDMKISLDKLVLDQDTNDHFIRSLMSSVVLSVQKTSDVVNDKKFILYEHSSNIKASKDHIYDILNDISLFVDDKNHVPLADDMQDSVVYDHIIDLVDKLLDDADIRMNELSGNSVESKLSKLATSSSMMMAADQDRLLQQQCLDIRKPQLDFLSEVDNSRERPFKPRLLTKPHAQVALDLTERITSSSTTSSNDDDNNHNMMPNDVIAPRSYYPHPYEYELKHLEYLDWQLEEPTKPKSRSWSKIEDPIKTIKYVDDMHQMIHELQSCTEIAMDLEHHHIRSYQGITCLMQISSRERDYIIDTIALRSSLHHMNDITANPTIIKVFHGCENDILWLQRDLGIYVVNCFDTYHAASLLRYPVLSYAHLLKIHCNVTANKRYQLADWRQRPLPDAMIAYARDDTHYLLYIYDMMRYEVYRMRGYEGLRYVYDASKKVCMKRYEKEFFWPLGYRKLLDHPRNNGIIKSSSLSSLQDQVLMKLYDWRDRLARVCDDSIYYILSNANLLKLGMMMPRSSSQLMSCMSSVSHDSIIYQHQHDIIALINEQCNIMPVSYDDHHTSSSSDDHHMISSSSSSERLYGRALKTPSKEVLGMDMMLSSPSPTIISYQPHHHPTIASLSSSSVIISSSSPVSSSSRQAMMASPVLFVDEVFNYAKWNNQLHHASSSSSSMMVNAASNNDDDHHIIHDHHDDHHKDDNKQRLALVKKALERYQSSSSSSSSSVIMTKDPIDDDDHNNFIPSSSSSAPTSSSSSSSRTALIDMLSHHHDDEHDNDVNILHHLPSSLADIYNISNDLRRKKVDKKRSRSDDAHHHDTSSSSTAAAAAATMMPVSSSSSVSAVTISSMMKDKDTINMMNNRIFDENIYLHIASSSSSSYDPSSSSSSSSTSQEVDMVMEVAQDIGWISSPEQRQLLLQQHMMDVDSASSASSQQQDEHSINTRPRSASGSPGNTLSKNQDYAKYSVVGALPTATASASDNRSSSSSSSNRNQQNSNSMNKNRTSSSHSSSGGRGGASGRGSSTSSSYNNPYFNQQKKK